MLIMACGKKKMALGGSTPGDPLGKGCKKGSCSTKTPPIGGNKPALFQRMGGNGFSKPKHKGLF
jgi:hypothetical protein